MSAHVVSAARPGAEAGPLAVAGLHRLEGRAAAGGRRTLAGSHILGEKNKNSKFKICMGMGNSPVVGFLF